jgi:hypothetical protein
MWKRSLVLPLLLAAGCVKAPSSPPSRPDSTTRGASHAQAKRPATSRSAEPLRQQVGRAVETLHAKRFSGLLHFENESERVFVSASPAARGVDAGDAHTGKSSLLLAPGTQRMTVKLSSVLAGRAFPGDWTLVGLYVRCDEANGLTISCQDNGRAIASRKVALPAGEWTAAMLDVSALPAAPGDDDVTLELRFDGRTRGGRCDDLLLIDNRDTLVDASPGGWTIKRSGFRITCQRKLRFNFAVVTTDGSPTGWEVEEASELRARFTSNGETKSLTLYADGRSLWDGAYKPLATEVRDDKTFAAAHASPAEVVVPETMGRVSRATNGDANNDGYNEQLGAYQVEATGGRLELTMTPRGTPVPRPVLQIAGMPQGKALVTIEGRLVEQSTRLKDGQLLVELPARITRATLVTVRIQ